MASKAYRWLIPLLIIIVIVGVIAGSFTRNYNRMVTLDESVNAAWAQVENVYQRRMDLIPNLVETVKGYAAHESDTLTAVTEARSKLGGVVQISGDVLDDPEMYEKYRQAQNELGSALQRLMVVSENYPELKANQNFLALQDQLEGTENRITVERRRFNETLREYNVYIKQFPRVIIARLSGFDERPYFEAAEGAETAPQVRF